jgi:hypothetical protein
MAMDNALDGCQADAGSFESGDIVQALERAAEVTLIRCQPKTHLGRLLDDYR